MANNSFQNASAPATEGSILNKYDITGIYAQNLNKLKGFKIVLVLDDSTSMRETLNQGQTKWDELRNACLIVLDIAATYKVECDVLFLNRPGIRNIQHASQLSEQFTSPPYGNTPLSQCVRMALENNRAELTERKLLLLIFTDGCPTSDRLSQKDAIKEFRDVLKHRKPIDKTFVTIIACTDDEYALKYMNKWDVQIPNLDVVDDFESEKKEIYEMKRTQTAFSFGDYIAKILLGSFVREIDEMDEKSKCTLL